MKNQLLIQFEWRNLLTKSTLILLVLFVIGKIAVGWVTTAPTQDDLIYERLIGEVSGELTEETRQKIEEDFIYRQSVLSNYPQIREQYFTGKMEYEEFQEYDREFQRVQAESNAFQRLYQKMQYFLQKESQQQKLKFSIQSEDAFEHQSSKISLEQFKSQFLLFYDTGWSKLIGEGSIDYLLLVFLMVICVPYMLKEQECGMTDVVKVCVKRNTLYLFKMIHILTFGTGAWVISQGIDVAFIITRYQLPFPQAALQSLEQFSNYPHACSILHAAVSSMLIKFVGVLVLLLFTSAICLLLKKSILTFLVYILLVFFPSIGQIPLPNSLGFLLFPYVLSGSCVLSSYQFIDFMGFPLSNMFLMVLFYFAIMIGSIAVMIRQVNR